MALRNIVHEGDPVLRKKCKTVTEFNERLHVLLDDMRETLELANGLGLAAPQVGMLKRLAVVSVDDDYFELINPEIIEMSGSENATEGCLSIPKLYGTVERPKKVTVKAQDRFGKEFTVKAEDLLARAFCHEIDHLDGILFTDIAQDVFEAEED